MYRDQAFSQTTPEPARDPNPVHHAAALVARMDRHDLEAIGYLVLERLTEIHQPKQGRNKQGRYTTKVTRK